MADQDELKGIWNSQPDRRRTAPEEIMLAIQKTTVRFDRTIRRRNVLESAGGLLVFVLFGYIFFHAADLLTRLGCGVTMASAAWIVFYMTRHGTSAPLANPNQTVTEYARALVTRYDYQIGFLKSVKYWYLLPMYVGLLILSAGRVVADRKAGHFGWPDLAAPAIYTAVFAVIWWLNEIAAVNRLREERAAVSEIAQPGNSEGEHHAV